MILDVIPCDDATNVKCIVESTGSIPNEITRLTSLVTVDLSQNGMFFRFSVSLSFSFFIYTPTDSFLPA